MENADLIDLVRPQGGWYGFLAVKDKIRSRQLMVETREELDALIADYVAKRWCVFFGLGKFKDGKSRTQENVESLKSYWLDIDCGPNKSLSDETTGRPSGYETQQDGLVALRKFCVDVGLPKPMLVNSGNGLHAYWPLTEDVPRDEWTPVVKRLRQLCIEKKFYIDTKVLESSRVLRPLNSFNFKGDIDGVEPKPVKIISTIDPIPFEKIRDILGVVEGHTIKPRRPMSAMGKSLMRNTESVFSKIMQLSGEGKGCAQLASCYTDRATLAEPRWFDALSVAAFCSDRNVAIHKLSEGHPDYDHGLVEKKVSGIKGPHSCSEFEANNPDGCAGCPHKGKIKSPISLGRTIARAKSPPVFEEPEVGLETQTTPTATPALVMPDGYFLAAKGGVYLETDSEDDEEATGPKLVYDKDLYIIKLMKDPVQGYVAVLKHHLPMDGVEEFVLTNMQITDRSELRKALAKHGVIGNETRYKYISEYLLRAIQEHQILEKAKAMRTQFGWADNDSSFIVGDREITATGVYHSPPASSLANMVPYFQPKGTLENWIKVFSLYGRPGLEIQAFGALSGFGAPLLKFTGQKGAVINFIHPDSGTGKTTILRMANSVFGDPEMLLGTPEDTDVGKILKVGFLNNIVNSLDEITNMSPIDASRTLYAYSQGRGKDKAKANANELRENTVTWRTISIASSNASFYEKLGQIKNNADGEMMRLLEFKVPRLAEPVISTQEGKDLLDHMLVNNYGVAGEKFIQYVLANLEEVIDLVLTLQAKIDKELRLSQRERNWSAVFAVNMAAGTVANRIGLLQDWNLNNIYKEVSKVMLDMRKDTQAPVSNPSAIIGDFINRHHNNLLVVEDGVDKRTNKSKYPELLPKGALLMRYEPDTHKMYIASKAFKADCVDIQINYKDTLTQLETCGIMLKSDNKRLGKGSSIMSPATRCLVFNTSHPDFVDMEVMVEASADDASGED
jgi:hypothetical protein